MELLEWLGLFDDVFVHPNISIQYFESTGRGIGCTNSIPNNTLILSIPKRICIHTLQFKNSNSSFLTTFFDNIQDLIHNYIPNHAIAFVILFLMLQQLFPSKEYESYLHSLPTEFSTTMYLFDEINSNEILKEKHEEKKNHFAKISSQVNDCMDTYLKLDYRLICKQHSSLLKWAYFVYNTRSVYMEIPNVTKENQFALVPFLDLLNHSFVPNCKVIPTNTAFEVHSINSIQPNEQLCFTYGNHDNYKLLVEYGFIVKDNPNQVFFVSKKILSQFLQSNQFENSSILSKLLPFLKQNTLLQQSQHVEYCIHMDGTVGWKLLCALKIFYLKMEQMNSVVFKKWLQEMDLSSTVLDEQHEKRVHKGIISLCHFVLHTCYSVTPLQQNTIITNLFEIEKQILTSCIELYK